MLYRHNAVLSALLVAIVLAPMITMGQTALPAESTFRVGLKTITIPSPSADLIEPGPDYRVLLEPFAPTNNRLVTGFLTADEFTKIRTSPSVSLTRYALVEAPRRAEFADITPEFFKQIDAGMAAQFGATINDTLRDQQDEINRRLKALGQDKTVTLDKPLMLGSFFSKPGASSYGQIMPITIGQDSKRVAMGVTLVRVRERILFLFLYNLYEDENSVKWIRTTSEQWADAVLAANR
jgi:hypothetical protein